MNHTLPSKGDVPDFNAPDPNVKVIGILPTDEIDVKLLAEAAYRRSRVLQAEVLASVRRFQESTGLVVEAIDVQQSEITRLGKREMLPGVKVKVVL